MTYTQCLQDFIQAQKPGEPIYTEQIADALAAEFGIEKKNAAAAAAVAMKRVLGGNKQPELRCYQKGIYYLTSVTPFGELGIDKEKLIADKYLLPNKGYETGLRMLHRMGLTTQMPVERLLATNAVKDYARYDERLDVSVCPPKTLICAENKAYLQTLDVLEMMDKSPIDVDDPYAILGEHIRQNGLQYETLLFYADKYYNRKTIMQLAHTAGRKDSGT